MPVRTVDDMRGTVSVVGVGTTAFGRMPELSADDLGGWALSEALEDAGLTVKDVDGLVVNRVSGYETFAANYGIEPAWVAELPAHGRMAGASLQLAAMAVHAGMCRTVALVYGNDGRSAGATYGGGGGGAADSYGTSFPELSVPYGMTSPGAFYALTYDRYRNQFGATSDELATVAMTFRRHAGLNPDAVMRDPITLEDYQGSRFIVEPLHIYDYCLINDGGVAIIVTSTERAHDLRQAPVPILGFAQQGQLLTSEHPPPDYWAGAIGAVAQRAFQMAGVERADVDGLMVYDNFSPNVLFTLEGLGFAPIGDGSRWIQGGRIELGGELPVNTSGGHLSESYMQGWGLNVEAVRQLRHQCGQRQIADASIVQYACAAPLVSSIIFGRDLP
jgi:acetyl-CoA acetyltransferase